jgi:hypothetical protein
MEIQRKFNPDRVKEDTTTILDGIFDFNHQSHIETGTVGALVVDSSYMERVLSAAANLSLAEDRRQIEAVARSYECLQELVNSLGTIGVVGSVAPDLIDALKKARGVLSSLEYTVDLTVLAESDTTDAVADVQHPPTSEYTPDW